ncbi:MAG: hypothetical protein KTR28_03330 [Micavibrio sp.]|nr:hypothetical protein [Micavibrio sp.]
MFFRVFAAILIVMCCMANHSYALDLEGKKEEKPVYAFFRLIERFPDFNYWASNLTGYKSGDPDKEKWKEFDKVRRRLKWGFGTYNEKEEFISLETPVNLSFEPDTMTGGYRIVHTLTDIPPFDITLFTYPYGEQVVAVYPKDLEKYKSLPIAPEKQIEFQKMLKGSAHLKGTLQLTIRPLKADAGAPINIADINHWILTGDVAYFAYEIENEGQPETIMDYTAPWYDARTRSSAE